MPCSSTGRTVRAILLASCLLPSLAGCGDDPPTEPSGDRVGPEGGTLSFANGKVTLAFPPGAVTGEVTISVEPATGYPPSPRLAGETAHRFGPEGTQFAEPVRLTISYDPENLPSGVRASELRLYRVLDAAWLQVAESEPDTARRSVGGPVDRFSIVGVLGVPVATVAVSPQSAILQVGETEQLTATAQDASENSLPDRPISWSISPGGVAEVDEGGSVTGLSPGEATITASSEGRMGTAVVTVVQTSSPGLELVASGLASPVFLAAPPGDVDRLFVVEQGGASSSSGTARRSRRPSSTSRTWCWPAASGACSAWPSTPTTRRTGSSSSTTPTTAATRAWLAIAFPAIPTSPIPDRGT